MGFFSYNCKECNHPLLSSYSADRGINDWMVHGVALTPDGGRYVGEYDGYGRLGAMDNEDGDGLEGAAVLHRACWELAGKPEYEHYGSPSAPAQDQGYFFNDEHDMIDPRIKEGREELLQAGVEARNKHRYDAKARRVGDWLMGDASDTATRFRYTQRYMAGKPLENQWYITDELGDLDYHDFAGTEAEAKAHCAKLWADFTASDECAKLLERAHELKAAAKSAYAQELKAQGRYEMGYAPSLTYKGPGYVERFFVTDKLTYQTVAEYDVNDPANLAREDRRKAALSDALRLNAEWAAAGYPV